jgi:two-component system chemotaxis response regulator CheY
VHALVIDDSRIARRFLTGMLKDLNLDVTEASGGREGLERLRQLDKVDLVLVDHYMPDMAGIDVVHAIRADPDRRGVRLVLVTGEEDPAQVRRVIEAGANESIHKPFTVEVLRETLQRLGVIGG